MRLDADRFLSGNLVRSQFLRFQPCDYRKVRLRKKAPDRKLGGRRGHFWPFHRQITLKLQSECFRLLLCRAVERASSPNQFA